MIDIEQLYSKLQQANCKTLQDCVSTYEEGLERGRMQLANELLVKFFSDYKTENKNNNEGSKL